MTNLHDIQPGTAGHTDTRSAQVTTVQHEPQEIHNMTPQQNAETPKELSLGISGGCLKVDWENHQEKK